jgi:Holliday junction resolvase RusA-like endonuclease
MGTVGARAVTDDEIDAEVDSLREELSQFAVEFWLPIVPRAKQSFRVGVGHGYTDPEIVRNAEEIAFLAGKYRPPFPLDGPVALELQVTWPKPKRAPKCIDCNGKELPLWRPGVPDWDNVAKQVMDALGVAGFWVDDRQIVDGRLIKMIGLDPGIGIRIEAVNTCGPAGNGVSCVGKSPCAAPASACLRR